MQNEENNLKLMRCVAWCAVSTKKQGKGASLPAQMESIKAFIDRMPDTYGAQGIIVETIELRATRTIIELSDAESRYPQAYGRLARMIRNQKFDILICYKDDRLGREPSLSMTIRALCRANNILVIESNEPLPATLEVKESAADNYRIAIRATQSRNEILDIQDRRRIGMQKRLEAGNLFPYQVPFGYKYEWTSDGRKYIAIVPDEAKIVRYILVDLYLLRGYGAIRIANQLNSENILPPQKGEQWAVGSVQRIIERAERYGGYLEFNRMGQGEHQIVKGNFEAILVEDEYRRIVAQREERKVKTVRGNRALTSIVLCADCGKPLNYTIREEERKDGSIYRLRSLTCRNQKCGKVNGKLPEKFLLDKLAEVIHGLATMDDLPAYVVTQDDGAQYRSQQDDITAQRSRLERAKLNLARSYNVDQTLSHSEYIKLLKEVEDNLRRTDEELSFVEQKLAEVEDQQDAASRLEDAQRNGDAMMARALEDPQLVNQWLRRFVRMHVRLRVPRDEAIVKVQFI